MGVTISALGIDKSSVASRPRLVREIRESIENEVAPPPLSEEIRREIDRRLANHAANPGAAIPWEEVKRSALARGQAMSLVDHVEENEPIASLLAFHTSRATSVWQARV